MLVTRKKIDSQLQIRILIGMITSDDYLKNIAHIPAKYYMQSTYAQKIARWCYAHFNKFEEAPKKQIQYIFENNSVDCTEEEQKLISDILSNLSKQSLELEVNVKCLTDESMKYFKKRKMELYARKILNFIDEEELEEAEKCYSEYMSVTPPGDEILNLLDEKEIYDHFYKKEENFFKLNGILGDFIGNLEQGWFVALSAGFKKGKTFMLQEFAIQAMLKRIPTIFYSLEMTKNSLAQRFYKRLCPSIGNGGQFAYPVVDCQKNQLGTCNLSCRTNTVRLANGTGQIPLYSMDLEYKPCAVCRGRSKQFVFALWYEAIERASYDYTSLAGDLKGFNDMYGRFLRYKIYPRFSQTIDNIKNHLDIIETREKYLPKIMVLDYADVLQGIGSEDGHEKEDVVWMEMARLATERNILLITATQINRKGQTAERQTAEHMAKWVGKLAHCDVMLTLNQSPEEKLQRISNIGILMHRHKEFDESQFVTVLQDIPCGQMYLDSEYAL